jgi:phosphopantetheinyl transferase
LSDLSNIEVRAAASGAPEVFHNNQRAAFNISLSHRDGISICAVAPANMLLGCDVEKIEPRSDAFVSDYFVAEEQKFVAETPHNERPGIVAALWSAKESALKAMQIGLRADTRFVVVHDLDKDRNGVPTKSIWRPMQVSSQEQTHFHGWWRIAGQFVLTIVGYPSPSRPVELNAPADRPI